jgi:hypothetical protein
MLPLVGVAWWPQALKEPPGAQASHRGGSQLLFYGLDAVGNVTTLWVCIQIADRVESQHILGEKQHPAARSTVGLTEAPFRIPRRQARTCIVIISGSTH